MRNHMLIKGIARLESKERNESKESKERNERKESKENNESEPLLLPP